MSLPALAYLFIFNYLPLVGSVLAFKDYKYNKGMFGSDWIGMENFQFLFTSNDLWRITRNSIGYGLAFIIFNTIFALILALLMYEVTKRFVLKFVQTAIILPNFLSWIMVSFIVYIFLNAQSGVVNTSLENMGKETFDWYTKAAAWPILIPLINAWKNVGWISLVYYSSLMALDHELFEAAELDGAGKWKQAWHISIPSLAPVITTMSLIAVGSSVIRQDLGLFYQVTRNSGLLYRTTDVIDTYVYRATVQVGDIGMSSAVGLFQTVVGLILVLITNWIIRKTNPESALF
jgi:putative aldouronate transport system permease protein